MAEQHYACAWTEVATALLKHLGIHEGCWGIGVQVQNTIANVPTCEHPHALLLPTHLVTIQHVNLVAVPPDAPRSNLVVDAAVVNPRRAVDWDQAAREELRG